MAVLLTSVLAWLRRSFIAGFFVTVPLVVSVVAIVWAFRFLDRMTSAVGGRLFHEPWPGLGIVVTALVILATGALTANVLFQRVFQRSEHVLLQVPLFRTIYAPVKQLLTAFAPENEGGFKRMVLIEDHAKGAVLGFLTKEFTVDRGKGPERLLAVYVPTNHLYLGDIVICHPDRVSYPDLSIQDGIRVFLSGGTGLPDNILAATRDNVD
jgi:uncharacterized membrane protein